MGGGWLLDDLGIVVNLWVALIQNSRFKIPESKLSGFYRHVHDGKVVLIGAAGIFTAGGKRNVGKLREMQKTNLDLSTLTIRNSDHFGAMTQPLLIPEF
jgi:hypothetical protein